MARKQAIDSSQLQHVRAMLQNNSASSVAKSLGVHRATLARALARNAPPEKKSGTIPRAPRRNNVTYAWDLESIRKARDAQMRGDFKPAVRLSESMRTDDAIFVARNNRIATSRAIATAFQSYDSHVGRNIAAKAKANITVEKHTLEGIHGTLVDHGIAVGLIRRELNARGTCLKFRLEEWPLEFVRWNPSTEILETQTLDLVTLPITHGDGTWVIFRRFGLLPWRQDAAILPASLLWAAHAEALQWWAGSVKSHGLSKIVGELPAGVPLRGENGELSEEVAAYLGMLNDIASGEAVAGLAPAESKVNFISNGSSAWQVFNELVQNREKAAMRIYCGTDATLGSVGGAPGVDISALFGVTSTRIQGDFSAIAHGINTGVIAPWVALNFGAEYERVAPTWHFEMQDLDATAKALEDENNMTRLLDAVKRLREENFLITQDVVDSLAARYNVRPAPILAVSSTPKVQIDIAPTDLAKAITVNEARASQGLGDHPDPEKGQRILAEVEVAAEAEAEAEAEEAPAQA